MDIRAYCKALMLLGTIRAALINGVKHYGPDGELLDDEGDIFDALRKGTVALDASEWVERTSLHEQTLRVFQEQHRAVNESN